MTKLFTIFEKIEDLKEVLSKLDKSPIKLGLRFELMNEASTFKRVKSLLTEPDVPCGIEHFANLDSLEFGFSYDEEALNKEQKIWLNGTIREIAKVFGTTKNFKKFGAKKFTILSCGGRKVIRSVDKNLFQKDLWEKFLDESRMMEMFSDELDKSEDVISLHKDFMKVVIRHSDKNTESLSSFSEQEQTSA